MTENTTATKAATNHNASQLCQALEFTKDQLARARAAGLVPTPDVKTSRWSGPVVEGLVARRQEILDGLPDDLDAEQLRQSLGLSRRQWDRAREAGLIGEPDRAPYWTRAAADALARRGEELRQAPAGLRCYFGEVVNLPEPWARAAGCPGDMSLGGIVVVASSKKDTATLMGSFLATPELGKWVADGLQFDRGPQRWQALQAALNAGVINRRAAGVYIWRGYEDGDPVIQVKGPETFATLGHFRKTPGRHVYIEPVGDHAG
ncbi:hypothetical protein AB0395_22215 [Streptosporangium sp. NPDC051023]|uniref:hypothetical protein n=1 Tax=Streptosporangium sp. NPDC051023 TaxID=3155410 RepID=UPI00344D43F8